MVNEMKSWVVCVIVNEGCDRTNSCVINDNFEPFSSTNRSKDMCSGKLNSENGILEVIDYPVNTIH